MFLFQCQSNPISYHRRPKITNSNRSDEFHPILIHNSSGFGKWSENDSFVFSIEIARTSLRECWLICCGFWVCWHLFFCSSWSISHSWRYLAAISGASDRFILNHEVFFLVGLFVCSLVLVYSQPTYARETTRNILADEIPFWRKFVDKNRTETHLNQSSFVKFVPENAVVPPLLLWTSLTLFRNRESWLIIITTNTEKC